jgi:tetratricopeptide (TPR) repeat protein
MQAQVPSPESFDAPIDDSALGKAQADGQTMTAFPSPVRRMWWPIFCLFQLGMIIGLVKTRPQMQVTNTAQATADLDTTSSVQSPPQTRPGEPVPNSVFLQGDRLFREARFESALVTYRSLLGSDEAANPDLLRYRIALCLERLGKWDQALAEFGAIRSSEAYPLFQVAAQLGRARVWIRKGQTVEAKNLVCDLLLRSGTAEVCATSILPECVHRLAGLMAQECSGLEPPGPLNHQAVARASAETPRDSVLDWITNTIPRDEADAAQQLSPVVIDNPSSTAEHMTVRGSLAQGPVSEALQQLTAACGRQCLLTPQAQLVTSDRTTRVLVNSLPLSTVLTAITEPLGLLWELTDNAVHICTAQEVTREALTAHRVRYAQRALKDALERYPDPVLTVFTQVELGNLGYSRGEFPGAAAIYEQLSASTPRSPVTIEASYNLGVVLRRLGKDDEAREAFYRVVDGSPGHVLAPLACLSIGRIFLDQAEFDRAVPPLRRAASIGSGTDTVPAAALLLASTYLLRADPATAGSILLQHREPLTEPPYRDVAGFVASYARLLACDDRRQVQREARVLTWAIVGASPESMIGPTGVLLTGHAYRELGLGDKMVEVYKKALQQGVPAALRPEMSFDMAEQSLAVGDLVTAIQQFTVLAADGSGKWNRSARLRLAEIALDDGRPADCRKWCRQLLDPPQSNDAAIALKLMGRAYEQDGIHQKAALCFAGHVPD